MVKKGNFLGKNKLFNEEKAVIVDSKLDLEFWN
jgi:hypothetical protein